MCVKAEAISYDRHNYLSEYATIRSLLYATTGLLHIICNDRVAAYYMQRPGCCIKQRPGRCIHATYQILFYATNGSLHIICNDQVVAYDMQLPSRCYMQRPGCCIQQQTGCCILYATTWLLHKKFFMQQPSCCIQKLHKRCIYSTTRLLHIICNNPVVAYMRGGVHINPMMN